ncbi:glutathione peroxidase [Luteolibacter pohnpeiensis]|uniref:Glutathione peroxidase n=2 Tax=Luteolibacter pohnpeiensis TaxID=454153 RepID=A0A934S1V4_9BACT|nr:glutathione peroxidase [Luteolibacter pohnpeiensis]MBK1880802.1 glutathione peroxidase [Luteolibacter pohnpeiensis]
MASTAFAADLTSIPFKDAKGKDHTLKEYAGKVVLIVNVASKCGNTPQYEGLEAMYKKHKDDGLVILGFPCNDFGGQEPGTIEEIQQFCTGEYDVTFPIMNKISVKGEEQHPLYKALTGEKGAFPGDVAWNFGKFLISRDGKPIARFEPKQVPESPAVTEAVEKALAEKKS